VNELPGTGVRGPNLGDLPPELRAYGEEIIRVRLNGVLLSIPQNQFGGPMPKVQGGSVAGISLQLWRDGDRLRGRRESPTDLEEDAIRVFITPNPRARVFGQEPPDLRLDQLLVGSSEFWKREVEDQELGFARYRYGSGRMLLYISTRLSDRNPDGALPYLECQNNHRSRVGFSKELEYRYLYERVDSDDKTRVITWRQLDRALRAHVTSLIDA
jgi:hypothetical protein